MMQIPRTRPTQDMHHALEVSQWSVRALTRKCEMKSYLLMWNHIGQRVLPGHRLSWRCAAGSMRASVTGEPQRHARDTCAGRGFCKRGQIHTHYSQQVVPCVTASMP